MIKEDSFVYSAYITLKNGRRIYARQYGKKAFCFPAKKDHKPENEKTTQN